jgi:hypothetical protein
MSFSSEGCAQNVMKAILLRNNKYKVEYRKYNSRYFHKYNWN